MGLALRVRAANQYDPMAHIPNIIEKVLRLAAVTFDQHLVRVRVRIGARVRSTRYAAPKNIER